MQFPRDRRASGPRTAVQLHALALLMVLIPTCVPAQSGETGDKAVRAQPSAEAQGANPAAAMMPMPMVAPLFLQNQEFSSTLYMVNELKIAASAEVTLSDLEGNLIGKETVSFKPNSQQRIEIGALLEKFKSAATLGSLQMAAHTNYGTGILGQLSLTHHGVKTTFFDEEMAMPSMHGSSTLRAVSDADRVSLVAITSLSHMNQKVAISCLQDAGPPVTRSVSLAPNQTALIRPCSENDATPFLAGLGSGLTEDPREPPRGNSPRSAGISLVSDAMPGGFAAYGLAYHGTPADGHFSSINFSDPRMLQSSGLVYTGIPVGEAALLPSGVFSPRVSVANFSDAPADFTVQFATTSGEDTRVVTVLHATIAGQRSQTYDLIGLRGDEHLQNSFIVHSSAAPGAVLSKLVARGEGTLREVELPAKDEHQMEDAGAHPWSIEGGALSTMFLFNHSPEPQYFNVRIADDQAIWLNSYKLNSMETRAISINDVIARQEKDEKGRVLPKNLVRGQAGWVSPGSTEVSGRILLSDRLQALARNFSCGSCNFLCGTNFLSPIADLFLPDEDEGQLGAIIPNWCSIPCTNYSECPSESNPVSASDGGVQYGWSGGGSVATFVSGTSYGTWKGTGPGTVLVVNTASMGSGAPYVCQGTGQVTDQVPTSLKLSQGPVVTYNGQAYGSVPHFYGNAQTETYTVLDQNGNVITGSGMTASEKIQFVSSNPTGYTTSSPSPVSVNAEGQFDDYQSFGFTTSPPPVKGQYLKTKQTISVTLNNKNYTVRVNCINATYNNFVITDVTSTPSATCQ